jgi:hypothetical protein
MNRARSFSSLEERFYAEKTSSVDTSVVDLLHHAARIYPKKFPELGKAIGGGIRAFERWNQGPSY